MKTYKEENYKRLLSQAIYIINQLKMAFDIAENHLEINFKRVKEPESSDMIRLHLPYYLYTDSTKFMDDYEKALKLALSDKTTEEVTKILDFNK